MQHYGWLYNCELVADFERITFDAATELPVIQFLNDLSYLKAKQADEKARNRNISKQ